MAVSMEELNQACEALAEAISHGDEEKKKKVLTALETMIEYLELRIESVELDVSLMAGG